MAENIGCGASRAVWGRRFACGNVKMRKIDEEKKVEHIGATPHRAEMKNPRAWSRTCKRRDRHGPWAPPRRARRKIDLLYPVGQTEPATTGRDRAYPGGHVHVVASLQPRVRQVISSDEPYDVCPPLDRPAAIDIEAVYSDLVAHWPYSRLRKRSDEGRTRVGRAPRPRGALDRRAAFQKHV